MAANDAIISEQLCKHDRAVARAREAVAAFVTVLFEPDDIIEIRRLPSAKSNWYAAGDLVGRVRFLFEENVSGVEIFIGANPRSGRGARANAGVCLARTLFVDLDNISVDAAQQRVEQSGLPEPSMTIGSGHGVHLYWRLNRPMDDLAAWREYQKYLIGVLNSDKAIHDPARIMRLPGFMNLKGPPVPCSIVSYDPNRIYSPSEVRAVPSPPRAAPRQGADGPANIIPEGGRNNSLFKLGAALRGRGAEDTDIQAALTEENQTKCCPPLPQAEVSGIVRSTMRYKPNLTPPPAAGQEAVDGRGFLMAVPEQLRAEAESMLADPNVIGRVESDIALLGVAGEQTLALTVYIIGTSRLLPRPLAGIVQGPSSTGKSFIIETVARLFPPEGILLAQRLTPQALIHMPTGSLRHRFVVAGERSRREDDDAAEATRALREMLSSGKLSKLMPTKGAGGRIATEHIEQAGPIAYIESTTQTRIFEEDLNRCIPLATDEQPEQTRRILQSMACSRSGPKRDLETVLQRHHALQRILALEVGPVTIPYAGRLAELFPDQRPEARRSFGHLLAMIEALTLLRVRQRTRTTDGVIIATPDDYAVARRLLADPMSRAIGNALSEGAVRLYVRLKTWAAGEFTSSEVYRHEQFSERQVRDWLGELSRAGVLKVIAEGARGRPYSYTVGPNPPDLKSLSLLPAMEQLFLASKR